MTEDDDKARGRWMVLQFLRLSGFAILILGLAVGLGKTSLPVELGYLLVIVGFFDAFVIPIILAKRWKSPPQ
ncbi:MAG: hypothetical protein R3D89_06650 [Sphingomonadaceae bacterium]|jgi:hypothetical protein